jgi:hypothetical protein
MPIKDPAFVNKVVLRRDGTVTKADGTVLMSDKTPSIIALGEATLTGGGATEDVLITGMAATDRPFIQVTGGAATTEPMKAVAGAGKITLSHEDGTGNLAATKLAYVIIRPNA